MLAGGLTRRANPSTLQLLRLEPNGSIKKATIGFDSAAPLGSKSNPPLHQGDVLEAERHGWAKGNDSLRSAVEPIGPLLNALSIFRLFGLGF